MTKSIVLGLAMLAGCATAAAPPRDAAPPRQATVRLGETARLAGVSITPLAILEDSRCPPRVQCVWRGRLRIKAALGGAGARGLARETELADDRPLRLADGRTLTVSAPQPATRFFFAAGGPAPAHVVRDNTVK